MSNPSYRIQDQLPQRYIEDYPTFIIFLKKYYDWLYASNLTEAEVAALQQDTSWIATDINKYIETGQSRYIQGSDVDTAITELNSIPKPGRASDLLPNAITLNVTNDGFSAANNAEFIDTNNAQLSMLNIDADIIRRKFLNLGFEMIEVGEYSLTPIDQVLMLSLLKQLYAIKGTAQSIDLFFNLFFGIPVQHVFPKLNIGVLDDHCVLDGTDVLRDDNYYDEFTYALTIATPITNKILDIFNNIYMKTTHPSGFRVFLSYVPPTASTTYLTTETGIQFVTETGIPFTQG